MGVESVVRCYSETNAILHSKICWLEFAWVVLLFVMLVPLGY